MLLTGAGLAAALVVGWWRTVGERHRWARQVRTLSPLDFGYHVAAVFQARGWQAQAGDEPGAALLAVSRSGVRVVLAVEHGPQRVDLPAVQAAIAARAQHSAAHAVVVTRGPGHTRAARQLAQQGGVPLWNLNGLWRLHRGGVFHGLPVAVHEIT